MSDTAGDPGEGNTLKTAGHQMNSTGIAERLDRLWSIEAIRQLAANYSHFVDSRDLDSLVGLFVEDVKVSRDASGRDALKQSFRKSLSEVGVTILKVTTHTIDFTDTDHAVGRVYAHGDIQIGGRWIHQAIRYDDRYERRGDAWYFTGRRHQLFYSADVGENPLGYPPADWPQSNIGLGTLPYNQPTWQTFWGKEQAKKDTEIQDKEQT